VSLFDLICTAFRLEPFQVSGPDWIRHERFDIRATFAANRRSQVPEMLQTLLSERFLLVARVEQRPTPVYLLSVKGDANLTEVAAPAELRDPRLAQPGERVSATGSEALRPLPDGALQFRTADESYRVTATTRATQVVEAERIRMASFASILRVFVDRPVIDKTDLPGLYQLTIELPRLPSTSGIAATRDGQPTASVPSGVSLPKELGRFNLELQPATIPLTFLVVEKAQQRPTEN
jgi:uncharacterized protein (TIGR03435 family)